MSHSELSNALFATTFSEVHERRRKRNEKTDWRDVFERKYREDQARDDHGRFASEGGGGSSESTIDRSVIAPPGVDTVKALMARMRFVEPKISRDIEQIASTHGGERVGREFVFKSESSLNRKVGDYMRDEGLTRDQATDKVKDALRYTVLYNTENYTGATRSSLETLAAMGYTVEADKVKNIWERGDAYQGMNAHITSPSGEKFEVQFHTPESFDVKTKVSDPLYHEYRVSESPQVKSQLWERMVAAWESVPIPPGVMSIGTPVFQARPE